MTQLSLTKELLLANFSQQLQNANREQAIELAIIAYRLYLETQQTITEMKL